MFRDHPFGIEVVSLIERWAHKAQHRTHRRTSFLVPRDSTEEHKQALVRPIVNQHVTAISHPRRMTYNVSRRLQVHTLRCQCVTMIDANPGGDEEIANNSTGVHYKGLDNLEILI